RGSVSVVRSHPWDGAGSGFSTLPRAGDENARISLRQAIRRMIALSYGESMIHSKALRSTFIGVPCLTLVSAAVAPASATGLDSQHVDWQVCDWYAHPTPGGTDWSQYPVTYCADVTVPLDWYDPSKGTISIRVTKVASTGGAARRGILMVDPGGPGSDGSTLATKTAKSQPALLS